MAMKYDFDIKITSTRIKEMKKKRNLNSKELSNISGVPLGTLNKILGSETKDPQLSSIIKISCALDVSTDYLLGLSPYPTKYEYKVTENDKDDICKFLSVYSGSKLMMITAALKSIARGVSADIWDKEDKEIFYLATDMLNHIGGLLGNFEAIAKDPYSKWNHISYTSALEMGIDIANNQAQLIKLLKNAAISAQKNDEDREALEKLMSTDNASKKHSKDIDGAERV